MPIDFAALGVEPEESNSDDLAKRLAKQMVSGKSREELLQLAGAFVKQQSSEADSAVVEDTEGMPQTPDELWDYIVKRYGVRIARVSVCSDHDTPFDFVCAGFFGWYPNVFAIGSRGGGKCLSEGTMVYDPVSGFSTPIEDLSPDVVVASATQSGKIVVTEASAYPSGIKECYEIVLQTGRKITCTLDHRFLTASGWNRLEDLDEGDYLALPRVLPQPQYVVPLPGHEVDLMAILLAEGNYTQSSVRFTCFDEEVVSIARAAAEKMGSVLVAFRPGTYGFGGKNGYTNLVRAMLDSYGSADEKATSKTIPREIFSAPLDQIARFITVFWMCDGHVSSTNYELGLASKEMVYQFQHLLLRFGIQSRIRARSSTLNGKHFTSWTLQLYASEFDRFHRSFALWGEKGSRSKVLAERARNPNAGRPTIPHQLMADVKSAADAPTPKKERKRRSDAIGKRMGVSRPRPPFLALTEGTSTVQARSLRAIFEELPGDWSDYQPLLSDDLWWDYIVSIDHVGAKPTYDLSVPEHHSFVANDLIVHNSYDTALLHDLNSHFKHGAESATFGAVEGQAKRVYSAFKTFTNPDEIAGKSLMSETQYKPVGGMPYGSKVEILGGTVAAVNSPHPQFPHSDEVEIMRADTWLESRNLAADKVTPDGRRIRGMNLATSTMKWKGGRVWQILEKFRAAKAKAIEKFGDNKDLVDDAITKTAPFYVLTYCLFEVAEQVSNCREAPENRDLPEWEPGLDRDKCKCDCSSIVNGSLESIGDDGQLMPRTLASECQGRFYRSRGHRSRGEVIQLFMQNDERTWKAQQLCRETETEGLYIPNFSRNRHGLARFGLDIANGPIYTGTDWGFTDEAAVVWIQYLERAVEAIRYDGKVTVIPRGARVAFSELTIARKTATELGQMAIMREIKLASVLSQNRVDVRRRWADIQGAGDRRDWAKMGLKTARYSTRDFGEHVKEWRGLVDADRFFVVVDEDQFTGQGCPFLCEQLEGWREEDGKESRELPQHVCLIAGTSVTLDSGEVPIERVQPGDMVLTRYGYRRVVDAGMTNSDAELWELETSDGNRLIGTANHPVMTDRGWTPLHAVRYGDYLWSLSSSSAPTSAKSSCSTASDTDAIRKRRRGLSRLISPLVGLGWDACIKKFGSFITARSQMDMRSIMLGMSETTRSTIFAVSAAANIGVSTTKSAVALQKSSGLICVASFLSHEQPRRLTQNTPRKCVSELRSCGRIRQRLLTHVVNAIKNLRLWLSEEEVSFAPTTASHLGDATLDSMTSRDLVNGAVSNSQQTDIPELKTVRSLAPRRLAGRAGVFNLTVDGPPEFFANGILVHNCSAGRYVLYGMHDIYQDSGAQSPEQMEIQKMSLQSGGAPMAVPYASAMTVSEHQTMSSESDWRARV